MTPQARLVDGFAGVYPEHKHRIVDALQAKGMMIGMTGPELSKPYVIPYIQTIEL